MDESLVVSLVVSGIGMLVLFLALTFLCGLMYLMTALIKDRSELTDRGERQESGSSRMVAAVIAVALARAEREMDSAVPLDMEEATGDWRALHHQRRLTQSTQVRGKTRTMR